MTADIKLWFNILMGKPYRFRHRTHSRYAGRTLHITDEVRPALYIAVPVTKHHRSHRSFQRSLNRHNRVREERTLLKQRHIQGCRRCIRIRHYNYPKGLSFTPYKQPVCRKHHAYLRSQRRHHNISRKSAGRYDIPLRDRYLLQCSSSWSEEIPAEDKITADPLSRACVRFFGIFMMCMMMLAIVLQQVIPAFTYEEEVIDLTDEYLEIGMLSGADPYADPYRHLPVSIVPLLDQISEEIAGYEGEWSVYLKRLDDESSFIYNDSQMPSASLIKLYTAGAYEQAVLDGSISATEYSEHLEELMITYSSNDAWKALEEIIGYGSYYSGYNAVTEFALSNGYTDSGRLFPTEDGEENLTSAEDVGTVLEQIHNGTYVSAEASQKILSYMLDQYYTQKIPAGLPEGIVCANKTGELLDVQNDAAIIYGEKCTYILVIMSCYGPANEGSWEIISHLSSEIYDYLNS